MNLPRVSDANATSEILSSLFIVEDPERVHSFLQKEQEVFSLLVEIAKKVAEYFPEQKPRLAVYDDYEDEVADEKLVVIIGTRLNANEAYTTLQRLDTDWWDDILFNVRPPVLLTL